MTVERCTWYDEAAGPLVRPYAVTRGRTRAPRVDLQLITLVVATGSASREVSRHLGPEHHQILVSCVVPTSVAELSAALRLPLSVVKILLGDLVEANLVVFRSAAVPDSQVLQAVINGIRQL